MLEKYNGWTNRETWLVNLHFGDSEGYLQEIVEDANGDISKVADNLEEMVTDHVQEAIGENPFVNDLINLSAINWYELAEGYVQEYWTEPTEEEEEIEEEEEA